MELISASVVSLNSSFLSLFIMKYLVKTPWFIKKIFPQYLWSFKTTEKELFLTFDDGPHPTATLFVLEQLKKHKAKATFFCVGKNVISHPEIFDQIIAEGHAVGNHSFSHLNGWKTQDEIYLTDIGEASKKINSHLFRPPYGRITSFQAKNLAPVMRQENPKVIMWDVLSADFDLKVTPEQCLNNVVMNSTKGSIIVFHDSEKAFPKLEYALPKVLTFFADLGYKFRAIEENRIKM